MLSEQEWHPSQAPKPEECTRCDAGWVTVSERYVNRMFPVKHDPEEEARQVVLRAQELSTVYPCKTCKPTEFHRWAGKHWEPDHEWWACEDCKDQPGRKHRT